MNQKIKIIKIPLEKNSIYREKLSECFDNASITNFGEDEVYYCIFKNNIEKENELIAISRICYNFQNKYYLTQNVEVLNKKIELNQNNVFLTGIWVKEEYRNRGLGKKLLLFRFNLFPKEVYIFSDIRKNSTLLKYYKEKNLKLLGEDEKSYFLYGKLNH